ncbi:MAG: hypothetical protein VB102_03955 [Paludibacter sp.]|nr:hypothetical protein [Paludibacter sp.]
MLKDSILIAIIFIVIGFNSLYCQSQALKFELRIQTETSNSVIDEDVIGKTLIPSISFNYQLNRWSSLGLHFGYTPFLNHINRTGNPYLSPYQWVNGSDVIAYDHSDAFVYGINGSIYLLPLLTKRNLRFDLYIIPSFSIVSENYLQVGDNSERRWAKPHISYGVGGGLKYAFTKKFNIFAEYAIGSYFKNENSKTKIGLGFKF